jgi:hypothetical protein
METAIDAIGVATKSHYSRAEIGQGGREDSAEQSVGSLSADLSDLDFDKMLDDFNEPAFFIY